MAASVIAAVLDRLDSFTWTGVTPTPTVWFDEAPITDTSNAAVAPPHVVLHDDGTEPIYTLEYKCEEVTKLRVEVYATSLAQLDAMVNVIKYNGGGFTGGLGLDFADTLTIDNYAYLGMMRMSEQRFQEPSRQSAAKLVFRCRMQYECKTDRTA